MKPLKTKAQIRAELEDAMNSYLTQGGEVLDVPRGVSAIVDNRNLFAQGFAGQTAATTRTLVNGEIENLEARKKGILVPAPRVSRPKKILIKDDFGEPLRWVWED